MVKTDIDAFIGSLEQKPFDSNSLKSYGLKNDDVIEVLHRVLNDRVSLNHYVAEERNIKNAAKNKIFVSYAAILKSSAHIYSTF